MNSLTSVDVIQRAQGWPLPQAALLYADAGLPVFPCAPGGKRPLTPHGFLNATTNHNQIRAWWRRNPEANIGMPTGPLSGLDVVDVDVREGRSGFDRFFDAQAKGIGERWAGAVRTPSGGMHYYFPSDPAVPRSSWTCGKAHVDFRGTGGYIIVPPSAIEADGQHIQYRLVRVIPYATPVDAERLRTELDPQGAELRLRARTVPASTSEVNEQHLADWVASRGEGERNGGLFWAACRMAEAGFSADRTLSALAPAAQQVGLYDREIVSTVNSAYRRIQGAPTPVTKPGESSAATAVKPGALAL